MIDPQQLLPAVQKLLPEYPAQELMEGIAAFAQAHPDLNNQQAIQFLMEALKHPTVQAGRKAKMATPPQKPFQGLINTLGAR